MKGEHITLNLLSKHEALASIMDIYRKDSVIMDAFLLLFLKKFSCFSRKNMISCFRCRFMLKQEEPPEDRLLVDFSYFNRWNKFKLEVFL